MTCVIALLGMLTYIISLINSHNISQITIALFYNCIANVVVRDFIHLAFCSFHDPDESRVDFESQRTLFTSNRVSFSYTPWVRFDNNIMAWGELHIQDLKLVRSQGSVMAVDFAQSATSHCDSNNATLSDYNVSVLFKGVNNDMFRRLAFDIIARLCLGWRKSITWVVRFQVEYWASSRVE